jgi:hypothetical protein
MSGKTDKNSKNLDIKTDAGKGVQGSRRRALKALVAGSALGSASLLPERWLKPVVESVIVPAHAQLSTTCTTFAMIVEIISASGGASIGWLGPAPTSTSGTPGQVGYMLYWDCTETCIVANARTIQSARSSITARFTVMGSVLPDVFLYPDSSFGINLETSTGAYVTSNDDNNIPAVGSCPAFID